MRLLQLLTEQADAQQQVLGLIDVIRQAKPFFQSRNGDINAWFYRGVNPGRIPKELFDVESTRANRPPTDTTPEFHQMMDDRLFKEFGHRYRSEATFVVGDRSMASDYGRTCIILPIGDFDFVYSKKVKDAYGLLRARRLRSYIEANAADVGLDTSTSPRNCGTKPEEVDYLNWVHQNPLAEQLMSKWFDQIYASFDYTKGTVEDACLSQNEIMLVSKQYAVIPYWSRVPEDILQAAETITKNTVQFKPANPSIPTTTLDMMRRLLPFALDVQ